MAGLPGGAAWLQAVGVVLAAVIALVIYALQAYRRQRRDKIRERQFIETALALGHEGRRLAYDGVQLASAADSAHSERAAQLASQAHQLGFALLNLPLERAPDPGLIAPVLQLRRHAEDIGRLATSDNNAGKMETFGQLQRSIDQEIARIDGIDKIQIAGPRASLRHRAENGMPTTTVDQYSTFRFSEDIYPEADGVDFEALVNNQSVLCTIPYAELNQLAGIGGIPGQHHRGAFEQFREPIQRAAGRLIREGAKAPVVVHFIDTQVATRVPELPP